MWRSYRYIRASSPTWGNPGTIGWDTVMSRWQPIRERMRLQFRAEMYGQITSGNRTTTMALRLEF